MNSVHIAGHLGQAPEIKYFESGSVKMTCSIGVSQKTKDSERTDWVNLEFWGKLAEIITEKSKVGDCLVVDGKLRSSSYTNEKNEKRTRHYVAVDWCRILPKVMKEQA